jgi:hypothetical protein
MEGAESSTMRPMEAGPTLARFLRLTLSSCLYRLECAKEYDGWNDP